MEMELIKQRTTQNKLDKGTEQVAEGIVIRINNVKYNFISKIDLYKMAVNKTETINNDDVSNNLFLFPKEPSIFIINLS